MPTLCVAACASGASPPPPTPIPLDDARRMFAEADALCEADGQALWGRSLCGR